MGAERDTVLILTNEDDHAADEVERRLAGAAIPSLRWDPGNVPEISAAGAWFSRQAWSRVQTRSGSGVHDFARVGAVWFRRPSAPRVAGPAPIASFVADQASSLTTGIFSMLDAHWVNDVSAGLRASIKPLQLTVAARLGWSVPETYVGNDPNEVLRVWERTQGQLIVKPFTVASVEGAGGPRVPYTRPVTPADLRDTEGIWASPAIWQQAVPKAFELRITVVGDETFAGAIDSQASERTRHDWRRYDFERVAHTPYQLPEAARDRCVALLRAFGLRFGAIDVIATPTGEFVFLEVNPFGQWLWMEQLCGLPIAEAHVRLFGKLLSNSAHHERDVPTAG